MWEKKSKLKFNDFWKKTQKKDVYQKCCTGPAPSTKKNLLFKEPWVTATTFKIRLKSTEKVPRR
jgi:hypothetical protein